MIAAAEERRAAEAQRFVDRSLRLLAVDAIALRDARSGRLISVSGDASAVAGSVAPAFEGPEGLEVPVQPSILDDGRAVLAVGVFVGDDHVASLEAFSSDSRFPDQRESAILRVLARLATTAIDASSDGPPSEDATLLIAAQALTELAVQARTYDQLLGATTAALAPLVGATMTGIARLNDRNYLQALEGSFGASPDVVASSHVSLSETTYANAAQVFVTRRVMFTNDARRDLTRFPEWVQAFGIERLMTLPLVADDRCSGVIHVANKSSDFDEGDARLLARLTPFVAGAIEQVRRRLEMERREAVANVVSRAATAIISGEHLTRYYLYLDALRRVLNAATAAMCFADGSPPVVLGNGSGDTELDRSFLEGLSQVGVAVRTSMARPTTPTEPGWAAVQVPVLIDGACQATIGLLRVPCDPFRNHERRAVKRMANVTALAWTTDRYRKERAETARMRERQRIADDLHDHVAQILFSGKLTLQSVIEQLDEESPTMPEVRRARDLLVQSEVSIRDLIAHLDQESPTTVFSERLLRIAEEVEEQFAVPIEVSVAGTGQQSPDALSAARSELLLSAAREAMVNAGKHAGKCHIYATVTANADGVTLRVVDDGRGLEQDEPPTGHGLASLRRRLQAHGGSLRIGRARPGTEVLVRLPADVG